MKYLDTDIVIIGAGSAGVAAAIAASQGKSKVVLIERNGFPGGKATASSVGTVCGLYLRSVLDNFELVHGGFVNDFVKELELKSKTHPQKNNLGLKFLPYKIDSFKRIFEDKIEASEILFLKNTSLKGVQQFDSSITQIDCDGPDGKMVIACKYIIDCSGIAIVSELANLPVIVDENLQSAAYVFEISGVENISETALDFSIKRTALKCVNSYLKNYLLGTSIIPGSFRKDRMMLKMGIPDSINAEQLKNKSFVLKSRKMTELVFSHLKQTLTAFKNASITHISDEIGDRVGKRPIGKYILTKEDVLGCKKFNDGIARGAWPVEKWSKGYRVEIGYFEENNFYHIPEGCLISKKINNLFFGGRSISADEDAIASARVIGTCLATGYASGMLAAGRLNKKSQSNIIDEIQSELFTDIPTIH